MRAALAPMLISLSCLLMTPGCGLAPASEPEVMIVHKDLTAKKCPSFAQSDKAEARESVERPAEWAQKGATKQSMQGHIDALEVAQVRKNSVIERMDREHEACRGTQPKTS